jgi:hypothetical protein
MPPEGDNEEEEEVTPEDYDDEEKEVPGTPVHTQLPLPPLLGALGEPQYFESSRRSPRENQCGIHILLPLLGPKL